MKSSAVNGYIVIYVHYPDCKNYEGFKIMVYKSNLTSLIKQGHLDPHFSDNKKYLSPIARFEPTPEGWIDAENFIRFKSEEVNK